MVLIILFIMISYHVRMLFTFLFFLSFSIQSYVLFIRFLLFPLFSFIIVSNGKVSVFSSFCVSLFFDDYYNLPLDENGMFHEGKQIECKMLDNQYSHQTAACRLFELSTLRRHSCTCSSQQTSHPPLLNTQIILPPALFILRSYPFDVPFYFR